MTTKLLSTVSSQEVVSECDQRRAVACAVCGVTFTSRKLTARYCSYVCSGEARRLQWTAERAVKTAQFHRRLSEGVSYPPDSAGCSLQSLSSWLRESSHHGVEFRRSGEFIALDGPEAIAVLLRMVGNSSERTVRDSLGPCWEWDGGLRNGYGMMSVTNYPVYVHRFSLSFFYDTGRADFACHRCDNPKCWRPSHLFAGDQTDNMQDAVAKMRASTPPVRKGLDNHKAVVDSKVIERAVQSIRSGTETQAAAARRIGVSKSTVWRWLNERTRAS